MYDKPKVTIDLDEYLELKENLEMLQQDGQVEMYSAVIVCLLKHVPGGDERRWAIEEIQRAGIDVRWQNVAGISGGIDQVFVSKKDKK